MIGVSPRSENQLQFEAGKRASALGWSISIGMDFRAKARHWLGKVSCLHAADSIEDVISAVPRDKLLRKTCKRAPKSVFE